MKDNTFVSRLAREGVPSGKIVFIHFRDGTQHSFQSCVNDMSGSRLSWFDSNQPDIGESIAYIKSVFRDIRKKATKIISDEGDF